MDAYDELIRQLLPDYQVVKVDADWTNATPEEHQAARAFLKAWDEQLRQQDNLDDQHMRPFGGRRTADDQ